MLFFRSRVFLHRLTRYKRRQKLLILRNLPNFNLLRPIDRHHKMILIKKLPLNLTAQYILPSPQPKLLMQIPLIHRLRVYRLQPPLPHTRQKQPRLRLLIVVRLLELSVAVLVDG